MVCAQEREEPGKVLVIDDELGPRESVRFLLNDEYDVLCEGSVDAGLTRLREHRPDVVILDMKMPGKNGIDGLREIRQEDPDVAVILLTGYASLQSAQEAVRLGANDYLTKPFDARTMRDAVRRQVKRTHVARHRSAAERSLEEALGQLRCNLGELDKLASLGQASCELAHDLNNPLTAVEGYMSLLRDELSAGIEGRNGDIEEYLRVIGNNLKRCRDMVTTWRGLLVCDRSRMHPCSVARIVRDAAQSCRPFAADHQVRIALIENSDDGTAACDPFLIARAVENLVHNAVQAAPAVTGVVTLAWESRGNEVEVRIEDNGPGIPPDALQAVFAPYATTKRRIGGTGLGLFIARKVIEEVHGGRIRLANRTEGGLSATIRIPVNGPGDERRNGAAGTAARTDAVGAGRPRES